MKIARSKTGKAALNPSINKPIKLRSLLTQVLLLPPQSSPLLTAQQVRLRTDTGKPRDGLSCAAGSTNELVKGYDRIPNNEKCMLQWGCIKSTVRIGRRGMIDWYMEERRVASVVGSLGEDPIGQGN